MTQGPTLALRAFALITLFFSPITLAQLTVYTSRADATPTTSFDASAPSTSYTGLPAYDPTRLNPPEPPQPPVTSYTLSIPGSATSATEQGLSISKEQQGNFLGFSIELSVAVNVLGKTGGTLKPEFLNYMANIRDRAGVGAIVRVGGNTQDSSTLYEGGFSNGDVMQKLTVGQDVYGNAINTPIINYSLEMFYTMANISSLVGASWYFGLAFNESDVTQLTENPPIVAEWAQNILGSNLRGLVVGNEPDLYVRHNHRPAGWSVNDYVNEYNLITRDILDKNVLRNSTAFVGPSLCCDVDGFFLPDVLNAGYLSDQNSPHIAHITAQRYPANNCQLGGTVTNAQDIFQEYLNHTSAQSLTSIYANDIATIRAAGKEIMMMEMNTASCGGFAGLSDSFGAAMWMTDWALQMAYYNFSSALMHVGGQNVYYNPFTPPPTTYSKLYQWTTGSVYYPTLFVAEAFGRSGNARIVDLAADGSNIYHPAYAIYEGDTPARLVLFNYVSDASGASNLQVNVNLAGAQIADSVSVRYFSASSVSEQYDIYWAGQTMGRSFDSDGRLRGDVQTETVQCTDGTCTINVPAPSIALVFLTPESLSDSTPAPDVAAYTTTVVGEGSATVAVGALATGNGEDPNLLGSTSKGDRGQNAASRSTNSAGAVSALSIALVAVLMILA